MKSTKNIKVYGTLVNGTLDTSVSDNDHNDVLMNAYQLYDGRFGATPASANFLDVINKRLTGITYADGDTTITGDLIVTGSIIGGDLGAHNLSELRDVNIAGIGANKYLKYDGTKWVPSLISLVDISEFDGLNGAVEGQVLKYRNGKWRPSADLVGENPITTINGLDDVDTTGATNGSVLKYNGTTWVVDTDNQTTSLNGLSDVNTSGAVNGSVLKYNGTTWVVGADNTGNNGATNLDGLSDVDTTGKADGMVLMYDASTGKWKPSSISAGVGSQTKIYTTTLRKVASCIDKHQQAFNSYYNNDGSSKMAECRKPGKNKNYLYVEDTQLLIPNGEIVTSSRVSASLFSGMYVYNFAENYNVFHTSAGSGYYVTFNNGTPQLVNSAGSSVHHALTDEIFATTSERKVYYNEDGQMAVLLNNGGSMVEGNNTTPNLYLYATGYDYSNFGTPMTNDQMTGGFSVVENNCLYTYVYSTQFNQGSTYYYKKTHVYLYNGTFNQASQSMTQADFLNKKKWDDGNLYQTVPYGKRYLLVTAGDDYVMPDEITAVIITQTPSL